MHLIITSLQHAHTLLHSLSSYIHSIHTIPALCTHTHIYTHTHSCIPLYSTTYKHCYTLSHNSVYLSLTLPSILDVSVNSPTYSRVLVPHTSLSNSPQRHTLTCHSSSANTRIQLIPSPNDRPISPLQIRSLQLLLTPLRSRVIDPQSRSVHRLSPTNT
jgi:hypothetical protein